MPAGSLQFVDFSRPDPAADRVERFMTAARHALAENDFETAAQRLTYARDAQPRNPVVLRLITFAFWQSGNLAAAGRAVRDWIRVEPSRPAPQRYASRIYEAMGATDLALSAAEEAARQAPTDAGGWERVGRLRLARFDRRGAIEALERARALGATVEGLLDLALAHQLAGDLGAAVAAAEQATVVDPTSAEAWSRLAHTLARTDLVSDALAACGEAIARGAGEEVEHLRDRLEAIAPRELRRSAAPRRLRLAQGLPERLGQEPVQVVPGGLDRGALGCRRIGRRCRRARQVAADTVQVSRVTSAPTGSSVTRVVFVQLRCSHRSRRAHRVDVPRAAADLHVDREFRHAHVALLERRVAPHALGLPEREHVGAVGAPQQDAPHGVVGRGWPPASTVTSSELLAEVPAPRSPISAFIRESASAAGFGLPAGPAGRRGGAPEAIAIDPLRRCDGKAIDELVEVGAPDAPAEVLEDEPRQVDALRALAHQPWPSGFGDVEYPDSVSPRGRGAAELRRAAERIGGAARRPQALLGAAPGRRVRVEVADVGAVARPARFEQLRGAGGVPDRRAQARQAGDVQRTRVARGFAAS